MMKTTFSRVALRLAIVCYSVFMLPIGLKAQERNSLNLTINTNKAEMVSAGAITSNQVPGEIFIGDVKTAPTGTDDTRTVMIPLRGHDDWYNTWNYIHIKVLPTKGLHVASIKWKKVGDSEENLMDNNTSFSTALLNKSDAVINVTYAVGNPPAEDEDDSDTDNTGKTYYITYKVTGEGIFEIRNSEMQGNKFVLDENDAICLELSPEEGFKIGHVKYEGKTINANKFNHNGIYCLPTNIKKDMHFDVTFVRSGENEDGNTTSVQTIQDNKLLLYPNPCADHFTLTEPASVMVYTLEGLLILKHEEPVRRVDVSGLAQGTYLVKVLTLRGDKSVTQLIKQ